MSKIGEAQGASDRITGAGMPEPTDGTSYDDTPGVEGPAAPAEFTNADGLEYQPEPAGAETADDAGGSGDSEREQVPARRVATKSSKSK